MAVILAAVAGLSAAAWGQSRPPKGPRALAILEWTADAREPRLLPLTVMEEGRFHDAAVYRVRPRPMALEPGTVYEAMRAGAPVGLFTVDNAQRVERAWIGQGKWRAHTEKEEEAPPRDAVVVRTEDDDERPRLRKPGSKDAPPAPESATPTPEPAPNPDADPDRPRLRRGGTSPREQSAEVPAPAGQPETATRPGGPPPGTMLLAVSDATSREAKPYEFHWNPGERERVQREMMSLAGAELARYARLPASAPAPRFTAVDLRGYDLDYDNSADVVLTARALLSAGGKAVEHYVMLVGRASLEGRVDKVFSVVTDDRHPEFTERYELLDVADADGNGRGDLVFRKFTGARYGFVVYRFLRSSLYKLFESAPLPPPLTGRAGTS